MSTFQFPAATTANTAATGFTFGSQSNQAATTAAATGFTFGNQSSQPAKASSTGFTFGSQPAQSSTSAKTGFSVSTGLQNQPTTSTPATGLTFGGLSNQPASTTTSSLQQGTSGLTTIKSTTAPVTAGAISFPAVTSIGTGNAPGISLNTLAPATTTASSFAGFGTTTTTGLTLGMSPNVSSGLANLTNQTGGNQLTQTSATTGTSEINLGLTTTNPTSILAASKPATSDPSYLVVGGTGLDKQTPSGTSSGSSLKDVKESYLIDEVNPIVNAYTQEVKKQKKFRDEINRMSLESIEKTRDEILRLNQIAGRLSNAGQRDATVINKLSMNTQQELKNTEIIQKSIDGPSNYQNQETNAYFMRTLQYFEESMNLFQGQIEEIEGLLASNQNTDAVYAPDYYKDMHDIMISLAVQLQDIHSVVKNQREQYIKYRRIYFKEKRPEEIFEDKKKRRKEVHLDKPKIGSNHNHIDSVLKGAIENQNLVSRLMANSQMVNNLGYTSNLIANVPTNQLGALSGLSNVTNVAATTNQSNLLSGLGNNFNTGGIQPTSNAIGNNTLNFGNQQSVGNTINFGNQQSLGNNTLNFGNQQPLSNISNFGNQQSLGNNTLNFGNQQPLSNNISNFGNQQSLGNNVAFGSNPGVRQNTTVNSSGILFGGNVTGTTVGSASFQLQNPPLGRKSKKK